MRPTARNSSATPRRRSVQPIRILSGEDEAKIAAEGTLAGIPGADGLVADLGGGSLDMVKVKDGKIGAATTLPFGPLRLMDLSDGNLDKARNAVEKGLDKSDFAGGLKGRALYAVGGIWRALAHVDMEQQSYPLHVLHHYVMPAKRAVQLCRVVAGLGRKTAREDAFGAQAARRSAALWRACHGGDDPCLRAEGGRHLRLRPARRRASAQASARRGGEGPAARIGARSERCAKRARRATPPNSSAGCRRCSPRKRRTTAAFAKRRACSPISAGDAIPTTAPWARSRKCCAAPMAAPTITSAP